MDPRGNVKAVRGSYGSSNEKVYAAGGELQKLLLKYPKREDFILFTFS